MNRTPFLLFIFSIIKKQGKCRLLSSSVLHHTSTNCKLDNHRVFPLTELIIGHRDAPRGVWWTVYQVAQGLVKGRGLDVT